MLAFIALFFPAAIMVVWKRHFFKEDYDWKAILIEYIAGVLLINFLVISIAYLFFGSEKDVVSNINTYNNFALKYMVLALAFAFIIPFLRSLRGKFKFSFETEGFLKFGKLWHINVLLYLYTAILFVLNLSRCFDNVVWGDEARAILLAKETIQEILIDRANDVHPPLYFIVLKLFGDFFGGGWHLVSLITYGLILVIGITWVRKKFGFGCATLFVTFCSLLDSAVTYNVEIRMYSMAAMFVLLAYIALYYILNSGKWNAYLLFAAFSLGAAYTHYYALFAVAFLYLYMLCHAFFTKKDRGKTFVTCGLTILGYLPWLIFFLKALKDKVTNDYWITTKYTWKQCFDYLFSGKLGEKLFFVYIIFVLLATAIDLFRIRFTFQIQQTKQNGLPLPYDGEEKSSAIGWKISKLINKIWKNNGGCLIFSLSVKNNGFSSFSHWVIAGQLAIIGTIGLGVIASYLIRPVLQMRYIFPVAIIAWLIFVACISKFKWRNAISLVIAVIVIYCYLPTFISTYNAEKDYQDQIEEILEETSNIDENSFIYTNISHFYWVMLDYYYPGTSHNRVVSAHDNYPKNTAIYFWQEDDPAISDLNTYDLGEDLWLFWKTELVDEELEIVEDAGYEIEFICEGNISSSYYVYVYHLETEY